MEAWEIHSRILVNPPPASPRGNYIYNVPACARIPRVAHAYNNTILGCYRSTRGCRFSYVLNKWYLVYILK